MSLHMVFDAAVPPAAAPTGCTGVLGYIGGTKATHTWTPAEWARFASLAKFPCWVPDVTRHAGDEAAAIISALTRAGWVARRAASGAAYVVIIDYETLGQAEAEWHSHLGQALGAANFDAVAYGSLSTVDQLEAAHVWAADWDNDPDLGPAGQTIHGKQYAADVAVPGGKADISIIDDWMMDRGRRG